MTRPSEIDELAFRIREGSIRALARGLTWIESEGERGEALSEKLYPHTGGSHVVGVTGAPGSGKSTLVRALTRAARERGTTVGIVAVDPSSPFSGGAILGDRIRMNDLTNDPGVFIRSMATRGALGGLCRVAGAAVDLLCAAGRHLVILETVGVGQDEVDVMRLALTTVVVSVPGLGDDIQTLKAGIIEIADIHVVNKADREGANRTVGELRSMLAMGMHSPDEWQPPIVACVATREEGASTLLDEVGKHFSHLKTSGELRLRQLRIAETRVLKLAQTFVAQTLNQPMKTYNDDDGVEIERVARRDLSPYQCARALLVRASKAEGASAHV
jgi:LAO/AO transport system kinase